MPTINGEISPTPLFLYDICDRFLFKIRLEYMQSYIIKGYFHNYIQIRDNNFMLSFIHINLI